MLPRRAGKPLASSLKARSYKHCSGVRKVPWGQDWGDRGHHRKSHFAEGSTWEDNGWHHGEGADRLEHGLCVPSEQEPALLWIPFVLLSPSQGWDTEKICCSFPCRTVGRKFCQAGNFAKALGDTLEGAGRGEGRPSWGLFGPKEEGVHGRPSRLPCVWGLVPQAAISVCRRQPAAPGLPASSSKPRHTEPGWAVI